MFSINLKVQSLTKAIKFQRRVKQGVNIKTVQELLGHSDINTTINIYSKVFPESKKESVNNLNHLLLSETELIKSW